MFKSTIVLALAAAAGLLGLDDDGATWSEPIDITPQVKADWMCFLGTGPVSYTHLQPTRPY